MSRNIYLFDYIYPESIQDVVSEILKLNEENQEDINLIINSNGGIVFDAFGLIDIMKEVESNINTIIFGQACSAGALISACGKRRFMTEKSRMMLHQVSSGSFGSADEITKDAERIQETNKKVFEILAACTKGKFTTEQLKDKVGTEDLYLNLEESIAMGLVDEELTTDVIENLKLSTTISSNYSDITVDNNKLSRIELLKTGDFHDDRYGDFSITEKMIDKFISNFNKKVIGRDVSFDVTHDNDKGEKPSVGWARGLIKEDDKLIALVKFNKKGRELISEKSFKYASADYVNIFQDESGKPHHYVLLGATLTNRPVIKTNAIKLSEEKGKCMTKEELISKLKSHGIDVSNLLKTEMNYNNQTQEIANLKQQNETLKTTSTELAELKKNILLKEKENAFNALVKEKKELPARKELVLKMYGSADEMATAYEKLPVLLHVTPKGDEGVSAEENYTELRDDERPAVDAGDVTKEEVLASRKFEGR